MIRRLIDEIASIHLLEPSLCDLFVEGTNDRYLLNWYISRLGKSHLAAVCIQLIDVPNSIVEKHGLCPGSDRSRVIALAYELHDRGLASSSVLCLIDLDFEPYIPLIRRVPLLLFTDYNSFETYLQSPIVLDKFLQVVLCGFCWTAQELLDKAIPILIRLFAIRLANEQLGWRMEWLSVKRYIYIQQVAITFEEDSFITAYLGKNSKLRQREEFITALKATASSLNDSPMLSTRGHDFTYMLHLVIRELKHGNFFPDETRLERALYGCAEFSQLSKHPLFIRIFGL